MTAPKCNGDVVDEASKPFINHTLDMPLRLKHTPIRERMRENFAKLIYFLETEEASEAAGMIRFL